MVETYQYPSEWRNNLKKGMIHSLYESSHCWKRTSIKHIQLIEKAKKSESYSSILSHFSDAELIDVEPLKNDEDL